MKCQVKSTVDLFHIYYIYFIFLKKNFLGYSHSWKCVTFSSGNFFLDSWRVWIVFRIALLKTNNCNIRAPTSCDLSRKNVHQWFCVKWTKTLGSFWQPAESFHQSVGGATKDVFFSLPVGGVEKGCWNFFKAIRSVGISCQNDSLYRLETLKKVLLW